MEEDKNYPIVQLTWADTHLSEPGWQDLSGYEDDGECLVRTVGFLIPIGDPGSKDKHVNVWQTLCGGEGIHGTHVPVGMVRDIKILG
jgi:hypothetical protein